MISALQWVPRKDASTEPIFYNEEDQLKTKARKAAELANKSQKALKAANKEGDMKNENGDVEPEVEMGKFDENGLPKDLNMETYDIEEHKYDGIVAAEEDLSEALKLNMSLKDKFDEIDEDDLEDYRLRDSDKIIVVASAEMSEGFSTLEVQVYDEEGGSLYIHHDITLPAFPLSLCRVAGCGKFESRANCVAVGMFAPIIELWDLDVINVVEPLLQLGYDENEEKWSPKRNELSHSEAVLALDSCSSEGNVFLVSGSADKTVKLWDLSLEKGITSFDHHTDKVMAVEFSPTEENVLLTAAFDKAVGVVDIRKKAATSVIQVESDSEISAVTWVKCNPFQIIVGQENGKILIRDLRKTTENVLEWKAHKSCSVSSIDFNPFVSNMFATSSEDKCVRLWDYSCLNEGKLKMNSGFLGEKEMALGKIFNVKFSSDSSSVLAAGGEEGMLGIWDFSEERKCATLLSHPK